MNKVEKGLFVSVEYTGTLENGDVFDTSRGRRPMEIQMGEGQLIDGFERKLQGMAMNEKKSFTLDPTEAYGERDESLMLQFGIETVPAGIDPKVGMVVGIQNTGGQQVPGRIVAVDESNVTVDLNHPLAGESLTFDIEVVGISQTPTQVSSGCSCDSGDDCDCG